MISQQVLYQVASLFHSISEREQ